MPKSHNQYSSYYHYISSSSLNLVYSRHSYTGSPEGACGNLDHWIKDYTQKRGLQFDNLATTTAATEEANDNAQRPPTNPPSFEGAPHPLEAERWAMQLEKIFKVTGCPDEQKVV
eukprot:TRINITY_DN7156_c0_g2_i1.p1 TRINITY_DN7156_c0_g2~~TRINITY_DN7156_c0_g2_i1.p1  ORF type:complete len:115 (-),score=16.48 TRINITY_DN7156_c0_g2_i1:729-1073(-)